MFLDRLGILSLANGETGAHRDGARSKRHVLRDICFAEDPAADPAATREVAAGLRALLVDGAEQRDRIEGDAGAIAALVHATGALALDDEFLGDVISRTQLHHEMATAATAGTRGKIGMGIDGATRAGCARGGEGGVSGSVRWRTLVSVRRIRHHDCR